MTLFVGDMDPITELSGVQMRLALGIGAQGAQREARECFDALLRLSAVRPVAPEAAKGWASLRTRVLQEASLMAWARGDCTPATQYDEERLGLEYELENAAGIAATRAV
jgi:hypothetical protein